MSLLAQLSLTTLALLLFYAIVWRRIGFSAERGVSRGTVLYDRGDFAAALKLYRSARQRDPKSALAWECEGLACVMLEQHDDAALALGHATRLQPRPVRQAHAYLALALARDGDSARALATLQDLVPAIDETRARADAPILAEAARAAGGEAAVCTWMETLAERLPSVAAARLQLAESEWRRGRPGATLDAAIAGREADPRRSRVLEALARSEMGDRAGAQKTARELGDVLQPAFRARLAREPDAARALHPTDFEDTVQRAMALLEGGDPRGAEQALDDAIALEAQEERVRTLSAFRALARSELPPGLHGVTAREKLALARAAARAGDTGIARTLQAEAAEIDPRLADATLG